MEDLSMKDFMNCLYICTSVRSCKMCPYQVEVAECKCPYSAKGSTKHPCHKMLLKDALNVIQDLQESEDRHHDKN